MKCTHSLFARKRPCLGQNGWVFFPFFRKRRDSSSKHNAQTGTPCLLWAQMQKINLLHLLGPISQLVLEHDAYTGQQQGTWMGPTRAGARRNRTPPDIRQGSGVRRDCGEFSDKHGGPGGQREEPGKSVLSFNFCYVHKAPACTRRACFHNNPAALFLMWHHHAVFASQQRSPPSWHSYPPYPTNAYHQVPPLFICALLSTPSSKTKGVFSMREIFLCQHCLS